MKNRIFPDTIVGQSTEQLFSENGRRSHILYISVLIAIVSAAIAVNYIHIDISVRAPGIIKPQNDKTIITSPVSGYIRPADIYANKQVNKGDTLFFIQSDILTSEIPMLESRKRELTEMITDLKSMTSGDIENIIPKSRLYRQDMLYYIAQLSDARAKLSITEKTYRRNVLLHEKEIIPLSELEPSEAEYTQAVNDLETLEEYQKKQWQSELDNCIKELREIENKLEKIDIQSRETVVCASVSGYIQKTENIYNGTFVQAGQQLMEISPDGELMAECYVAPKDIGLIRHSQESRIQVAAFNYNDWGVLTGTVSEIYNDISVSADQSESFYKVYCTLSSDCLTLRNGYKGHIRKGMTINANFIVAERTVYQLLYDKVDNWLNPNIIKANE